jgi:nitroreductase
MTESPTTAGPTPEDRLGLTAEEVLTTTRAVRKRLDLTRPVPRALLVDCVRVAAQAPSGRNRQRWDFVFVDDEATRSALADVWRRGSAAGYPSGISGAGPTRAGVGEEWQRISDSAGHLSQVLHRVPVLLVPVLRVESRDELHSIRGQAGAWGSVLPAFWSFMLAARERGLGTAWTTCHLTYEREAAEVLGIPYATVVQGGLSPVAYTVGTSFRPGARADHELFIHWNQW